MQLLKSFKYFLLKYQLSVPLEFLNHFNHRAFALSICLPPPFLAQFPPVSSFVALLSQIVQIYFTR